MAPFAQQYLGFQYRGQEYQFVAMPFGLSIAPRIFTLVMKDVMAALHKRGIHVVVYLDDFLIIAPSFVIALEWTSIVLETLRIRGFLVNLEKSQIYPSMKRDFLGITWDSEMQASLSVPNAEKLANTTRLFRSRSTATLEDWQSFLGSVNFA